MLPRVPPKTMTGEQYIHSADSMALSFSMLSESVSLLTKPLPPVWFQIHVALAMSDKELQNHQEQHRKDRPRSTHTDMHSKYNCWAHKLQCCGRFPTRRGATTFCYLYILTRIIRMVSTVDRIDSQDKFYRCLMDHDHQIACTFTI